MSSSYFWHTASMDNSLAQKVYDTWYQSNRELLLSGTWDLIDEALLTHPQRDTERGLNLIAYIPEKFSLALDALVLPHLPPVVSQTQWIIPPRDRHITILDVIPHNIGNKNLITPYVLDEYAEIISCVMNDYCDPIPIVFQGIFASPNGITVQGYPVTDYLDQLRSDVRMALQKAGLVNLENSKYIIGTAHSALIKFIKPLNGPELVDAVDQLRRLPLGTVQVTSLSLTISSRFDKSLTNRALKTYTLL